MGAKIFAFVTVIAVLILCRVNTVEVTRRIDEVTDALEVADDEGEIKEIRARYKGYERLISISVSHEDLMAIDDLFSQYEAEVEADAEGTEITKSRLLSAFSHLRRLCTLNIDSVI